MAIIRKYRFKVKCTHCKNAEGMSRSGLDLSKLKCSKCKKTGTMTYLKVKRHKTLKEFRFQKKIK